MASPTDHEESRTTEAPGLTLRVLNRKPIRFLVSAVGVGCAFAAVLLVDAAWSGVETSVHRGSRSRRPPKDTSWTAIAENLEVIRAWLGAGLSADVVHGRLSRRGVVVPLALVQRYADCYERSHITIDLSDSAAGARHETPKRLVLVDGSQP